MELGRLGVVLILTIFSEIHCDLSDFGGDVRQYMSLLQGSSAFSFSPQKDDEEKRKRESGDSASAMGDFGGDYGDYLKLLESNSALGFNPQADPIGDNQVSNGSFIFDRKLPRCPNTNSSGATFTLLFSFPGK